MFDHLVRAQHFGAPTRLADVSQNPLAALWFACSSENRLADDGKIVIFYMKDNKTLKYHNSDRVSIVANLATLLELEREALRKEDDSDEKKKAKKTLESAVRNEKPGFESDKIKDSVLKRPLLMLPKQNNECIIAQQGAFIIFGLDKEIPPDWRVFVSVYEIPWYAKGDILKALEVRGIHEQSIYPDIRHCAQYLKSRLTDTIGQLKKEAKWEEENGISKKNEGNKDAQFQLGLKYFQGYRIKNAPEKAIKLWEQAAKKEDRALSKYYTGAQ